MPTPPADRPPRAAALAALLVACRSPAALRPAPGPPIDLSRTLVVDGPLSARLAPPDGAAVVLLYGAEERGDPSPCGCADDPKGGLARQAAYVAATRAAHPEAAVLWLNAGGWALDAADFSGGPRADAPTANAGMVAAFAAGGLDAANLGYGDMMGLRSLGGPTPFPVLSANIDGPGLTPSAVFSQGGLRIGVLGLSAQGSAAVPTAPFVTADPYRLGAAAAAALRPQVDLLVLLSAGAGDAARRIAEDGLADVVIDANSHHGNYPPLRVGGAVWVRAHFQTERMGELRLGPAGQRWAVDRQIDLDDEVPEQPAVDEIVKATRKALKRERAALFGERG